MDEDIAALDRQIGERVRGLRAARSLSLDDLAEKSGVSRAMLSRIERGESSPTAQLLNRVCAGLGGTLERVIGDAVWRLAAGDCLRMRLDKPIVFHNPSGEQVRYAVIICRAGDAS